VVHTLLEKIKGIQTSIVIHKLYMFSLSQICVKRPQPSLDMMHKKLYSSRLRSRWITRVVLKVLEYATHSFYFMKQHINLPSLDSVCLSSIVNQTFSRGGAYGLEIISTTSKKGRLSTPQESGFPAPCKNKKAYTRDCLNRLNI